MLTGKTVITKYLAYTFHPICSENQFTLYTYIQVKRKVLLQNTFFCFCQEVFKACDKDFA